MDRSLKKLLEADPQVAVLGALEQSPLVGLRALGMHSDLGGLSPSPKARRLRSQTSQSHFPPPRPPPLDHVVEEAEDAHHEGRGFDWKKSLRAGGGPLRGPGGDHRPSLSDALVGE